MNLSDGSRIHPDDLVLENRTLVEEAASWDKFNEWVQDLSGQWCFRGQQEASWLLTTKLDRDIRVEYQSKFRSGIFHIERREEEAALVCAFKQIAPEYICQLPAEDDLASWLSLLQHYGAPTRLLDWTYSPHIAAFFAMENESMLDGFSSIFAFDLAWLQRSLESYGLGSISTSDALRREQTLAVVRIHPAVPNERMRAQKGLFLGKLFDKAPFYVVLASMMMHSPSDKAIRKLIVPSGARREFLRRLEEKNICRDSLLPGTDFGETLRKEVQKKVAALRRTCEAAE